MDFDRHQRVGEIAGKCPATILIFEAEGVEFAARGNRTLDVACDLAGLDPDEILGSLRLAPEGDVAGEDDLAVWTARPVSALINFLTKQYHRSETKELARINMRFANLPDADARRPELKKIRRLFRSLSNTLPSHMFSEEKELFPYIEKLEQGARDFETETPVKNPVLIQYIEHDTIAEKVEKIRLVSSNFARVKGESRELRDLFRDLEDFERRFLRHLHLENNVLFPRALEMENALRGKAEGASIAEARH